LNISQINNNGKLVTNKQIIEEFYTHSLTAALDQLRVVASSTSNDPGPRSRQHQQIGQRLLPLAAANFSVDDPAGASSQQPAGGVPVWASIDSTIKKLFKIFLL